MPTCPECEGKGEYKLPSDNPLHVYKTDGPTVYETYTCDTCDGSGSVSRLKLAVYKARGGPAHHNIKGFA